MTKQRKYVKVFEELEAEDLPPLRGGQKAAISRGDDILSDEQYAACYLNAIQALGRAEDTRGRGDTGQTRKALKMVGPDNEDWQNISAAKLSIYLDLKPQTVERTVSKFKLLLQGERSGTESNVIWPELVNIFDRFESMPKAEVIAMAEEAINQEADDTRYREYLDKMNAKSKESLIKKKMSEKTIYDKTFALFKGLRAKFDGKKAARMAMTKISTEEEGLARDRVKAIMVEGLKKDPVLQKFFKDADKPDRPAEEPITVNRGQDQTQR